MKSTTVVNVATDEFDVYIGRPSEFGNNFIIGKDGTRDEVIKKYRDWFYDQPELLERAVKELSGKRLGCFCKPKKCHGDILANYVNMVKW